MEDDSSSSSISCYQYAGDSSNSPNIKFGCRDSCCNVINSVNTLVKGEENEKLIIQLINQSQNPKLQKDKKQKSTISFQETLKRLNKKKSKDLTVNDLQHEIYIVKQETGKLKHNNKSDNNHIKPKMIMLKDDKSNSKHDKHKDGDESSQQALLSKKGIDDVFNNSQLALVNKIIPPKWFTKVKIVVSHDYHFVVIAMIVSGADMNCIQEGLIPSKYFEKSTERLVSSKIGRAHV